MPRVAVNDLVVHPRDNDLVLATHGRGIWILDNLAALQSLTPAVLASDAQLFAIEPAQTIRYASTKAHAGDMIFRGANPPAGAIIDYYLRSAADKVGMTVHDARGRQVSVVEATGRRGVNRALWNLRYPDLGKARSSENEGEGDGVIAGPLVLPGTYTVRLAVSGKTLEQQVEVTDDPRLPTDPEVRRQWTDALLQLTDLDRSASVMVESAKGFADTLSTTETKDPAAIERRETLAAHARVAVACRPPLHRDQRQRHDPDGRSASAARLPGDVCQRCSRRVCAPPAAARPRLHGHDTNVSPGRLLACRPARHGCGPYAEPA